MVEPNSHPSFLVQRCGCMSTTEHHGPNRNTVAVLVVYLTYHYFQMYRGYHKIAPWIPGREPWRRTSSTRSDGVVTTCVSEQQQDGNHTVGEMERQLLLMLQGVTLQVIVAMDGEGDLAEVKQLLSLLPAYTDEEADKQMMSMIQRVGRQAISQLS